MKNHHPRVSIGMPVFNGEEYLEGSLHSILAQSYSDFELIISDNASTDRTQEICQTYATQDRRIGYFRNEDNLGAAKNFNRTFQLSSGEYFKWAAHDDVIAHDFLSRCVDILDGDPSVVLCHAKNSIIDEHGKVIGNYDVKLKNVGSPRPQDRFADLILIDHLCFEIFGLIRASILSTTPLIGSYIASDRVLIAQLCLLGRFHVIPEHLFFSREHQQRSITAIPFHLRAAWFDPAESNRKVMPHWRFYFEFFRCVNQASIDRYERALCHLHLIKWPVVNLNWARLLADLILVSAPRSLDLLMSIRNRYYEKKHICERRKYGSDHEIS